MTILRTCLLLLIFFGVALGQQDDVVRINTELVQTGVAVFDKQGQFVDGLKKEDFELRVEGRVVPISFFENIVAGTQRGSYKYVAPPEQDPKPMTLNFS